MAYNAYVRTSSYAQSLARVVFVLPALAFADKPPQPVLIKSSHLEILFDRSRGLPLEYHLLAAKTFLRGEDTDQEIGVTIFRAQPRAFTAFAVRPEFVRFGKSRADFQFTVREKGVPMASFLLRYELNYTTVYVSLEAVVEEPGYELIDVSMPTLASVREEDGGAWLAHGDQGGTVVSLSKAAIGRLPENRFWGRVATTLPVVMIGTNRALCVEEVLSYMDTTELAVEAPGGRRRATLGTVKTWRVNGNLSYDMNTGPNAPRISGNAKTPNLIVGGRPLCRLDFATDFDRNGTVDWLDGAKMVRGRIPEIPTHYYDDKLMYMIHCDEPKLPEPQVTFEQAERIIHQVALVTGGAPQDVYLWGWQYQGKDTGYPAIEEVNPRLGGYMKFLQLKENARAFNATVSFSDNYDDAYKSSPAWDPAMIARRPDGELWESRNWTGENSYIIGLAKYMDGPGVARIAYTADHYQIRDTYLIDVLSYYTIRNDWDPEHPASGIRNLTDGRYKVIEEFKKRGLDVVSEELRYAMLGRISVADNGPAGETSPFGGEPIPLVAAIYRKSAIWGMRGEAWKKQPEIFSFFYNGHEFPWMPRDSLAHITEFYYGTLVPWYQIHFRDIESYVREGDRTVLLLDGESKIDLDWRTNRYSVIADGVEVARDGDTFCPIDKDRVAFYSKEAKRLAAPLPAGWDASNIVAFSLSMEKTEVVSARAQNGKISVEVQPSRPVIVFRDAAAAKQRLGSL